MTFLRQRGRKLALHDLQGQSGASLAGGLADAYDGRQTGAMGSLGLGLDVPVELAVVGAALGVANDHGDRTRVRQHLGGDVAGMGAGGCRMAILRPDRQRRATRRRGQLGDQRRRRADHDVHRSARR